MSGRISSFRGVSPPPSLNSPTLYLSISSPCAVVASSFGEALEYSIGFFVVAITSEDTMCWHGDEEDEDSSEVKCLIYVFLAQWL